jgi:hypothetical protein
MSIVVSSNSGSFDYDPAPAGVHTAVCVDVVDLGEIETQWGKKHKISLLWQLDKRDEEGRPFIAVKRYTASLSDRAILRKDLETWRAKPFTEQELQGYDLEKLIGINTTLVIVHKREEDKVYSNVDNVLPPPNNAWTGMKSTPDYVRVKERKAYQDPKSYQNDTNDSQRGAPTSKQQQKPAAKTQPATRPPKQSGAAAVDHLFGGDNAVDVFNQAPADDDLPF